MAMIAPPASEGICFSTLGDQVRPSKFRSLVTNCCLSRQVVIARAEGRIGRTPGLPRNLVGNQKKRKPPKICCTMANGVGNRSADIVEYARTPHSGSGSEPLFMDFTEGSQRVAR